MGRVVGWCQQASLVGRFRWSMEYKNRSYCQVGISIDANRPSLNSRKKNRYTTLHRPCPSCAMSWCGESVLYQGSVDGFLVDRAERKGGAMADGGSNGVEGFA